MNDENNLRNKTVSGLIWRYAERCGAQGVSFIVSIILARILLPDDYGLIAIVTVFLTISQVFVDSGLGTALIQKKNADDLDFSTVFWFNVFFCLIIYAVLFLVAPLIGGYYNSEELVPVLRVISIVIIISALKNVQQAYVSKHMMFRKFFFATLGGTIAAAIVGIIMAYKGFGVWALVVQTLLNTAVDTIVLWLTVGWHPKKMFSFKRLKSLFSYGWKLLVSTLINTVYQNLRQLIIGKLYSSADLSYYNRGQSIPNMVVTNINTSIDSVLLPAMSQVQSDREIIKAMTRRAINVSSYIMWPLMLGLTVVSESLVSVLLTDKWLFAVPYLQVFAIIYAFEPVHTANLSAIKALGRSDLFFRLEIIKKIIGLLLLFIFMRKGVFAIALSLLIYNVIAQIVNSWPNRKLLGYSYMEQLKDIIPYILLSLIMVCAVYPISFLKISNIVILLLQVVCGAVVYIALSYILKLNTFNYILNILKSRKK